MSSLGGRALARAGLQSRQDGAKPVARLFCPRAGGTKVPRGLKSALQESQ